MDSPEQAQAAKRAKTNQTIVQAPINVESCLFFSNLLAMRKLRHGDTTYSNLLMESVVAATEGHVTNAYQEASSYELLGLRGALEPCFDPPVTVFALPKLLRLAARV